VATHPAVFPTFTAPSFGPVHTRYVRRHTCTRRSRCYCQSQVCHPRTGKTAQDVCPHGRRLVCFARHEDGDRRVGSGLCPDCYDYQAQVVWNLQAGELWRRTTIAVRRALESDPSDGLALLLDKAITVGVDPATVSALLNG